jgi:malate dehydrogenase (quinone)
MVEQKHLSNPSSFIAQVPHMSLVWGDKNVSYLKKRYELLKSSPLFKDMIYTEDRNQIAEWAPIVMSGRPDKEPVAATRMEIGTDVNFGELTRGMLTQLEKMPGVTVHYNTEALDLDPDGKGGWDVFVRNRLNDEKENCNAGFVFIGAGGATLNLLKKAEIKERKGYGGFPVSGLWLKCKNEELIKKHNAKVYGKA